MHYGSLEHIFDLSSKLNIESTSIINVIRVNTKNFLFFYKVVKIAIISSADQAVIRF